MLVLVILSNICHTKSWAKNPKNIENTPNKTGGNHWAQHFSQGFVFFVFLISFDLVSFEFFCFFSQPCTRWTLPSPKTQKNPEENQKTKNKKETNKNTIPWTKSLGRTFLARLWFLRVLSIFFFESFFSPVADESFRDQKPKNRRTPKKNSNPQEEIFGHNVSPKTLFFFGSFVFWCSSRFFVFFSAL